MKLPRMTNRDFDRVNEIVRKSGLKPDECPTCHSRILEVAPGVEGRICGIYMLDGEAHECNCEDQITLYRHYLLAGIGDQYQRLDWSRFYGSENTKDAVEIFLDGWINFRNNGMGLEFSSPNLGVGKTFAATHVGKELIKHGEKVQFIPFLDVIRGYQRDDAQEFDDHLREVTWLILDEVVPPWTAAQANLFASSFEALIRCRQNYNRPVIMTTNLTPEELREHYERTYSLLEAKQIRVEMTGEDARQKMISHENIELVAAGEIRPIS